MKNKIDANIWDPDALDAVLVYLYTGEYDELAIVDGDTALGGSRALVPFFDVASHASKWLCAAKQLPAPGLRLASKETVTKVFLSMIQVYFITTEIGLEELRFLVAQKFFGIEQYFIKSEMSAVMAALFAHVDVEDRELRLHMIKRCVVNYNLVKADVQAVTILHHHEFAAWTLGLEMMNDANESNKAVASATASAKQLESAKGEELAKITPKLQKSKNEVENHRTRIANLEAANTEHQATIRGQQTKCEKKNKQPAAADCEQHKIEIRSLLAKCEEKDAFKKQVSQLQNQLRDARADLRNPSTILRCH